MPAPRRTPWRSREVVIEGTRYRRHHRGRETYYGLAGATTIARWTCRDVGGRNGPTIVPLALRAGLVEGATPALAFSLAQGYAQMPLRTYAAELTAAHRCVPARSTLERLGKALARALDRARPTLEPTVRAGEPLPAQVATQVASLSVGLDRTAAPMAEPPTTPRASRRRTPYVRRPPAPVDVVYRMALGPALE